MRCWKQVAAAGGAMLVPGTPLWAHQDHAVHVHSGDLLPLLAVAAALASFLLWLRRQGSATREE